MDENAGLTPAEIEEKRRRDEAARLATRDGQAEFWRVIVGDALKAGNLDLAGQGVQPRIDSVIQGLTMVQAEFVAMFPQRGDRRRLMAEVEANLPRLVALRTSVGGAKSAKVLDEPLADQVPKGRG